MNSSPRGSCGHSLLYSAYWGPGDCPCSRTSRPSCHGLPGGRVLGGALVHRGAVPRSHTPLSIGGIGLGPILLGTREMLFRIFHVGWWACKVSNNALVDCLQRHLEHRLVGLCWGSFSGCSDPKAQWRTDSPTWLQLRKKFSGLFGRCKRARKMSWALALGFRGSLAAHFH